ncbi:MAG TPA: FxLYD domain-containing protein [Ktedonobacteraceae bacterium]
MKIDLRVEVYARQEKGPLELQDGRCHHSPLRGARNLALAFMLLCLVLFLSSCGLGDQQQAQQPDPRLKSFHIQSSRIIILDSQAEVDGTIQNTGHDRYPFDVTVDATFYDKAGNVIGQAEGVAEDVLPGMSRAFVLMGQVDSLHYSHMELTLVSLRERRKEPNLPTPPPVSP